MGIVRPMVEHHQHRTGYRALKLGGIAELGRPLAEHLLISMRRRDHLRLRRAAADRIRNTYDGGGCAP